MTDPTPTPPSASTPETAPVTPTASGYRDDELVYVDPDTRMVVGRVEWSRSGNPKSKIVIRPVDANAKDDKGEKRRGGRKHYPWGTYRSMKGAFRLEGKKKHEATKTLDEVIEKALAEPFWD